ncbi:MAG: T9SS type A sorting domain-containing protein, partial [Bacteroidetes bacterium]
SQYNDNYLYFIPVEKWIVNTWGNTAFSADYLYDVDFDQELITDQLIGKLQPYRYHPQRFEYWYNFTTSNWTFQNYLVYDGTFANGVRVSQNLLQENMGVLDTLEKQNFYFDPCFGYQGAMYYSKDMLNNWVLGNGTFYDATTIPYGSTCYVTDYDRYTNFSTTQPSGVREFRWVITQAGNLGTEELLSESITIYPNPTNDILNVEVSAGKIQSLNIYDINGGLIKSFTDQNDYLQVNVSHLEKGIYLLEVVTEKGTEMKRFVKN